MFEFLRRVFRRSDAEERRRFFEMIDALNAELAGGQPTTVQAYLGSLRLRSGTLVLGDPQWPVSIEVPDIAAGEASISATLWKYPPGTAQVTALRIALGDDASADSCRKIGQLAIDSARIVVADKADIDEHWTETGPDRIGVITTPRDDAILRLLKRRFGLKTTRVSRIRAEVVGPVPESLEQEIEDYLNSIPKYAEFPYMYFRVQTNNSFDRVNALEKTWAFMPVGNEDEPRMFTSGTGRGDGLYDVYCEFASDVPIVVSVAFIEDGENT